LIKILAIQRIYIIINNPNPIALLFIIITITLSLSLIRFIITINHWLSILIIITYIGGLIILFLYVISLLPNSKQKWSNLNKITIISIIIISIWINISSPSIKIPIKTLRTRYFNNTWTLIIIIIIILLIAQIASKIIFLPFKIIKSTY